MDAQGRSCVCVYEVSKSKADFYEVDLFSVAYVAQALSSDRCVSGKMLKFDLIRLEIAFNVRKKEKNAYDFC